MFYDCVICLMPYSVGICSASIILFVSVYCNCTLPSTHMKVQEFNILMVGECKPIHIARRIRVGQQGNTSRLVRMLKLL